MRNRDINFCMDDFIMKQTCCVHIFMFLQRGIGCCSKVGYLWCLKLSCLLENFFDGSRKSKKLKNPQQLSCMMCQMLILCVFVVDNVPSSHSRHWFLLASNHGLLWENGPMVVPYRLKKIWTFLDFGCMDLKQPQTFIAISLMMIDVSFTIVDVLRLLQALTKSSEEIFLENATHIF